MFQIGDRVACLVDHPDGNQHIVVGSTGTICSFNGRVGVCWDDDVGGHRCDSDICIYGHGWWINDSYIELIEEDDSDIEIDENKFIKLICR